MEHLVGETELCVFLQDLKFGLTGIRKREQPKAARSVQIQLCTIISHYLLWRRK